MNKSIPILTALLFIAVLGNAQAHEGTTEYDKKSQPALIVDYSYPPEAVEGAITQRLESYGYKGKEEKGLFNKDKGFRVYKAVIIPEISSSMVDLVVNVERKSRKEKDESTLYLIIDRNGENIINSANDSEVSKAKDFLNNMIPDIQASNLELQITAQQDVITKSEKKLKSLRDDQDDLEKKLRDNQRDQESAQKVMDTQRQALEALKAQRKNGKT